MAVTMTLPRDQDLQTQRPYRGLTTDAVFRLWRAAIKDDDQLVDGLIEKFYDHMFSFNRERTEAVMELVINRDPSATLEFAALLSDMPIFTSAVRSQL